MKRWLILGVALAICSNESVNGQQPTANIEQNYKYAVVPQAGQWMVCVQCYKDQREANGRSLPAQKLAEELAEYIRTKHKLPAYLYDWGRVQRGEEEKRVADRRKQQEDLMKAMGATNVVGSARIKTVRIEDEFAVLIGGWKDMDTARKALDSIRKLPPPPEHLCHKMFQTVQTKDGKGSEVKEAAVNPFLSAMVAPNMTAPRPKDDNDPNKPDPLLGRLNAGESYSVLKCSKPWTLVVKVYNGHSQIVNPEKSPSLMDKIGFGWSLRRLCTKFGIQDQRPDPLKPNWPDTELLGNYILREQGIKPCLIGTAILTIAAAALPH